MRKAIVFVVAAVAACSGGARMRGGARPTATLPEVKLRPPVAEVRVVKDTYHGTVVEDPYQWLEGDGADVQAWGEGQDRYARAVLDQLPESDALRAEITAVVKAAVVQYGDLRAAGGKLFALRRSPELEHPELVAMTDPEHPEAAQRVLDPAARGAGVAIDWYVPSPDGSRVAVSLSEHGSEVGTLHVIDLDGKDVEPAIPNVQRPTGGGDVAWTPDGKGLYYTRYRSDRSGPPPAAPPDPRGAESEKPEGERDAWMQVWFHALGTPVASDRYEMGKDLPKIAEITLASDARGRVLASVQNGDGGTFRHYLRDIRGTWHQLDDWDDGIVFAGFGPTSDLWLVSKKDAPKRKVLRLPSTTANIDDAKLVIPEGGEPIVTDFAKKRGIDFASDQLWITYQTGGPTEMRVFSLAGAQVKGPALPPVTSVGRPTAWGDGALVQAVGYTLQPAWYRFSSATGALTEVAPLSPKLPVDLSGFEVLREQATSKDGTRVPYTVIWPKGARRDGSVPCVATGYGGFGISVAPKFMAVESVLLRRGICWVHANLRGGSELGDDWHRAGMLLDKQHVFDDFAAVLGSLAEKKLTSPDRLAITGASNGGLLMGATVTQHPELVRAVVSDVGIYDMLRVERTPNGQYNIPEYGTVADPAQFAALYAYSPYHHVTAGTAYPATLLTTALHDGRVAPWQSRKMTAALQAARRGDTPVLLRVATSAGHGANTGATEVIDRTTHVFAFLRWQLR
ncbi:MAG: S9 family peptidase [Deltaproteobacteria bacterium]|nr:S9 family peptidase [Deltaproteobacteria bacterium]